MPLTIGGGIRSFEHAAKIFDVGADKLLIGSMLHLAPDCVEKVASNYGSQAIVASLDCKLVNGEYITFSFSGCNKSFTLSEMISRAHDVSRRNLCNIYRT